MSGSTGTGEPGVVDYARFAGRLAAARRDPDPARRWDLLHEFQAEWDYVPAGKPPKPHEPWILDLIGAAADADPDADPGIPAALAEWWIDPANFLNDRYDLYPNSGEWPPVWRPDPDGQSYTGALSEDSPLAAPGDDRRVCVFLIEAQYCNEWGYLSAESQLADPRVLVSVGDDEWAEQARSVSEFAVQCVATYLVPHFGWTAYPEDYDEDLARSIRAELPELGLLPWRELGAHAVLHGGPDVIVEIDAGGPADDAGPTVRAFGRSRAALDSLAARFGGTWEIVEPEAARAPGEDQ